MMRRPRRANRIGTESGQGSIRREEGDHIHQVATLIDLGLGAAIGGVILAESSRSGSTAQNSHSSRVIKQAQEELLNIKHHY